MDDAATVDVGGVVTVLDTGQASLLFNDTNLDLPNDALAVSTDAVSGPDNGRGVV